MNRLGFALTLVLCGALGLSTQAEDAKQTYTPGEKIWADHA